ncbi:MAG TPA: hypothetical protein DCG13_02355 [Legionellales bacterium]|nr:hypothetical protein [Legionellales bacterium]HCA90152.1 hypothetical protein [Legionellales bacterium]|tara:strand:+ start:49 stop:519 length:471 start_codon:yes stop_codon:yes gene_type:complete
MNKDTTPYERPLVESVVNWLEAGLTLRYSHRDYCGTGFTFERGEYLYCEFNEGEHTVLKSFSSKAAFIEWLTQQSDLSLARLDDVNFGLRNNQVITRARLIEFINEAPRMYQEQQERQAELIREQAQSVIRKKEQQIREAQEREKWQLLKEQCEKE